MRTALLIGACSLLIAAGAAQAQSLNLRSPVSLPVGESPFDVLVTDLDGDHHLDFISANFAAGTITVYLGDGTGGFTALEDQPASTAPIKMTMLFADADTNLDMVVSEGESDFIYLLRGNGDGTFQEPAPFDAGHDAYALASIDMNHDDKVDIVETLASETGGRVNVLLGDGEGNFDLSEDHGQRLNAQSYGVIAADLDGDTIPDVAATTLGRPSSCDLSRCGTLAVMKGMGDGSLGEPVNLATGSAPFAIAAADLDHDQDLDIVVADSADDVLSVFTNMGNLQFERTQRVPVGTTPGSLVLVDFDGDGWLEAVAGNVRSGDISVVAGLPGGTFGQARHFISGVMLNAAAVGDFNEDERLDLIGVNQGQDEPSASLLFAREEGGYNAVQSLAPTTESFGIAVGDVQGDGLPDIALSIRPGKYAHVIFSEGVQKFSDPLQVPVGVKPTSATLRDLNADGHADLVVTAFDEARLSVSLATGGQAFAPSSLFDVGGNPTGLAVADLDGDGHPDLAATSASPPTLSVLFGNGDGSFAAAATTDLTGLPGSITVGDFDSNGIDDIAVGNAQVKAVTLLLGNHERTLTTTPATLSDAPGNIACADFDADGQDDLVVTAGNFLRVLYGTGGGAFMAMGQLNTGRPITGIAARDVSGDLRPDVIVSLQGTNDIAVFVNGGNRTFQARQEFLLGLRPGLVGVGDFDGDGRYDIGVSGTAGWVLTGDGEGALVRGDGNGDGGFSAADVVALQSARARGHRVEDIRRGGEGISGGADANGDGLLDAADEQLTLRKPFDS